MCLPAVKSWPVSPSLPADIRHSGDVAALIQLLMIWCTLQHLHTHTPSTHTTWTPYPPYGHSHLMLDYCVGFFSVPYLLLSKSFVALYHGIYLVFVMAVRARLWQWSSAIWLLQPDMTLEPAGSESFGKSKHTDMLQISAVVHVTSLDTTFVWSQSFIYLTLGLVLVWYIMASSWF